MSPAGGSSGELDPAERVGRAIAVVAAVVVEGAHPQCARRAAVRCRRRRPTAPLALGEALGFGEQHAVLVDHRLAVPGQVGGRLALARGGVHVGGQAARRRRAGQQLAVVGAADGDRAAGQVGQHRRAGQRGLGARRHRHPHVLADLDVQHEARQVGGGEQQVRTERHVGAADADRRRARRRRARSGGVRRTRGRWAGRTSAPRRAPCRGGSPPRCCRSGCGSRSGAPTTSTGSRSAEAATTSASAASTASSRASCSRMSSIE